MYVENVCKNVEKVLSFKRIKGFKDPFGPYCMRNLVKCLISLKRENLDLMRHKTQNVLEKYAYLSRNVKFCRLLSHFTELSTNTNLIYSAV